MICDFNPDRVCWRCGFHLPPRFPITVNRCCPGRCRYFGPQLVDAVKVPCDCHPDRERHDRDGTPLSAVWLPVFRCEIFRRCLPSLGPALVEKWREQPEAAAYAICRGCERAEFIPAAAPDRRLPGPP